MVSSQAAGLEKEMHKAQQNLSSAKTKIADLEVALSRED